MDNQFTGKDIKIKIKGADLNDLEIEYKEVDCECIFCGLRVDAELPFADRGIHLFTCPNCEKEFPLDLAIIAYLDEGE